MPICLMKPLPVGKALLMLVVNNEALVDRDLRIEDLNRLKVAPTPILSKVSDLKKDISRIFVMDVFSTCFFSSHACIRRHSDLYICGSLDTFDTGNVLASAGPRVVRGDGFPLTGQMRFNIAFIDQMKRFGSYLSVITHEMVCVCVCESVVLKKP